MTQRERVVTGMDGWAAWQILALACVTDKARAAWVMTASLSCSIDQPDEDICDRLIAQGVPLIVHDSDLYPPPKHTDILYSLVRFVVGTDCTVVAHYTQSPTSYDDPAWKCAHTEAYDGTLDVNGHPVKQISDIRFRMVATFSTTPLMLDDDLTTEEELIPLGIWGGSAAYLNINDLSPLARP